MQFILVIPARYASTRLPGKPLIDICGVPMVVRTYRQCRKVVAENKIFVATDDERITEVCRKYDIQNILTSRDCLTGTDRVAEVSRIVDADCYINVQGDEPVFNPNDILELVNASKRYPDDIINGYCQINKESQYRSSSVPKVIMRQDSRLLYMSRAPIPANKENEFRKAYRQVCAYAFPKKALHDFASVKMKAQFEDIEDIEILRFLELGYEVRMIPMSDLSIAVDNPEDISLVEERCVAMRL